MTSECEDATALAARLARDGGGAAGLLDAAIARIEALDPALGAIALRDFDRARAAAAAADARLARGERAPLLGVPAAVKESFDMAGLPTCWGLEAFRGRVAAADAVAVARLRAAGGVLLAKTNVSEGLAGWRGDNPVHGRTDNPAAPGHTPGGSSGGSAAAVAAGLVPLALASDLGGSTRVPAHFCGVFGHDPTDGLVPLRGHRLGGRLAPITMSAPGVIARSARDLALGLGAIAGPDEPEAAAWRLSLPPPRHTRPGAFRVLVLDRHPLHPTDPEVAGAVARLAASLASAGAQVRPGSDIVPDVAEATRLFAALLAHAGEVAAQDGEAADGSAVSPDRGSDGDRGGATRPATPAAAWAAAEHPVAAMLAGAAHLGYADWVRALEARAGLRRAWLDVFRDHDVLLCPPAATVAPPHALATAETLTVDGEEVPRRALIGWAAISKAAGLPASVVPAGRTRDGLPVGVQIIGPACEDLTAITLAGLLAPTA